MQKLQRRHKDTTSNSKFKMQNLLDQKNVGGTINRAPCVFFHFFYFNGSGFATASSNLACSFTGTLRNVK